MIILDGEPVAINNPVELSLKIAVDANGHAMSTDTIYALCNMIDRLRDVDFIVAATFYLPILEGKHQIIKTRFSVTSTIATSSCMKKVRYDGHNNFPAICVGMMDIEFTDRKSRQDLIAYMLMHEIGHIMGEYIYGKAIYDDLPNENDSAHCTYSNVWRVKCEKFADFIALVFFRRIHTYREVVLQIYHGRYAIEKVDRQREASERSCRFDGEYENNLPKFAFSCIER